MRHFLLALLSVLAHNSLCNPHAVFIVDAFPKATKSVIENQIIGLIEHNFDISIICEQETDVPLSDFLQKNIKRLHYGPLDTYDFSGADIIVCQYGSLGKKLLAVPNFSYAHIPCVTFFRGADITAHDQIKDNRYKALFLHNRLLMPVCYHFAYLLEILGCDPEKIWVQPSGINIDQFTFRIKKPYKNKPLRLISVCRLIEKKGCAYTLHAVAQLIKKGHDIRYTIIGDGKQRKKLRALAKKLRIAKYVTFLGRQPHETIAEHLNKSHIFILPSVTCLDGSQEGIANALKEAMAIGLPVITTYHGGNRELIQHEYNGFLVPERHSQAISATIILLLKNMHLWESLIKNARKVIEKNYDMNSLNTQLAHKLTTLIEENP